MQNAIWESLYAVNGPKSAARMIAMPKYAETSLESSLYQVRDAFETSAALSIGSNTLMVEKFWSLTTDAILVIGGVSMKRDWEASRSMGCNSQHFSQIGKIAESFFGEPGSDNICCIGGHSVVWNEVRSQKVRLNAKTRFVQKSPKRLLLEDGAVIRLGTPSMNHFIRLVPQELRWGDCFYNDACDRLLFTMQESKREFWLPPYRVSFNADVSAFYKGDCYRDSNGKQSRISAPLHQRILASPNIGDRLVERTLFFDAIHLELTRFSFCKACSNRSAPPVWRDSLYLALHPQDFRLFCVALASQAVLDHEDFAFSQSTYGRCLKQS